MIVDEQGKIVLVNAQAEKLFGYKREELLSQSIEILIPDRYRHSHELQRLGYIDNPHVRQMGGVLELYALRKDGTECPVEVSLSPLDTDEGLLVSSTIRDITMRKQAEEDLRVALAKEKELNLLKSHFVSMVSHEFRTPLAGIQTAAELIERYSSRMTDERRAEHLVAIQARVSQLILLLDQILLLSKAQSVGLEFNPLPMELESFCHEIIANLPDADQRQRIELALDDDLCIPVSADTKLLTLALNNLFTNALKYSPQTSVVRFAVSCDESSNRISRRRPRDRHPGR